MKKPNLKQLLLWLRCGAMIVLVVLSTYGGSPRRGFLSTLPLIPLACLLSSLLYYSPKYTVALAALCSFSFTVADGCGIPTALVLASYAALAAWLSSLAAKHLARLVQKRQILSLLAAILLLCPAPLIQTALFSTPWDNQQAAQVFQDYVQSKYPDQEFSQIRTYYNPSSRSFEALLFFSGGKDVVLEERLVLKDGAISQDSYFLRFCQKGLEQRQSQYVSYVRERYPDAKLWLDCSKTTLDFNDAASFAGTYGSIPQWLEESTALELGFQFTIPDNKAFLETVKEYLAYLNEAQFPYDQIRFFGGDQGVYLYTLTATPDTTMEELASLIRSCKISMNIPSISLEYSYLY